MPLSWRVREHKWFYTSVGAALCSAFAAMVCLFFQKSSLQAVLPIYFLVLIVVVADRFGALAGMFGTLFAAAVFAFFLFEPLRSAAVKSQAGRNSLFMDVPCGYRFIGAIRPSSTDEKDLKVLTVWDKFNESQTR